MDGFDRLRLANSGKFGGSRASPSQCGCAWPVSNSAGLLSTHSVRSLRKKRRWFKKNCSNSRYPEPISRRRKESLHSRLLRFSMIELAGRLAHSRLAPFDPANRSGCAIDHARHLLGPTLGGALHNCCTSSISRTTATGTSNSAANWAKSSSSCKANAKSWSR